MALSPNKKTIRMLFKQVFEQRRVELLDDIFDEEMKVRWNYSTLVNSQSSTSYSSMKEFILNSDIEFEIIELIEEDNKVVAFCRRTELIREKGPYKGEVDEGSTTSANLMNIYHFSDGKVVQIDRLVDRFKVYRDHHIMDEALSDNDKNELDDYIAMLNRRGVV